MEYKTLFSIWLRQQRKSSNDNKREIYFKKQVFKGQNWDTYECGKE